MNITIEAEEIKEIRSFYGLTQKAFAQLLGIGVASIVRYEQGATPSKANANLIRAARHPDFMRECIERDGDDIPVAQRDQAMRVIYACVSLEPEEDSASRGAASGGAPAMSKMDEMYHYTIQQEVLNEQAANLACDLMSRVLAEGADVRDACDPLSAILAQLLRIKLELISERANDDAYLEQVRGYLNYLEELVSTLSPVGEVA